jgi:hypothetical protein
LATRSGKLAPAWRCLSRRALRGRHRRRSSRSSRVCTAPAARPTRTRRRS